MKTRLSLRIDENVLADAKRFAAKNGTSVSELVEEYFRKLTRPLKRKSVVDIIKELNTPTINTDANLKELYHIEQKGKHGFN